MGIKGWKHFYCVNQILWVIVWSWLMYSAFIVVFSCQVNCQALLPIEVTLHECDADKGQTGNGTASSCWDLKP